MCVVCYPGQVIDLPHVAQVDDLRIGRRKRLAFSPASPRPYGRG